MDRYVKDKLLLFNLTVIIILKYIVRYVEAMNKNIKIWDGKVIMSKHKIRKNIPVILKTTF